MTVSHPSAASTYLRASQKQRERAGEGTHSVWVTVTCLSLVLGGLFLSSPEQGTDVLLNRKWEFVFWAVLVGLVNLLPIRVKDLYLTLDAPLIIAIAILYPPVFGALVGLIATIDLRELRRQVNLSYAVFNRLQAGISVFLASSAFHLIAGQSIYSLRALGATLVALLVDYLVNVGLVLGGYLERGGEVRVTLRNLKVGGAVTFLGTYLGYGLLALILANVYRELGVGAVVIFLIPIVVAQQMLTRTERLEALAEHLRYRETLVEHLTERIVDERRDERLRIAGELHDGVLQSLLRVRMSSGVITNALGKGHPLAQESEDVRNVADEAIEDLRRLLRQIRESPLGHGGLVPTLESLIRDLRLDSGRKIALHADRDMAVSPRIQIVAYQVAREALSNALRHGNPREIVVKLQASEHGLEVEVRDDGDGFNVEEADSPFHFGLRLLDERLQMYGGELVIDSAPTKGTTVRASLPK